MKSIFLGGLLLTSFFFHAQNSFVLMVIDEARTPINEVLVQTADKRVFYTNEKGIIQLNSMESGDNLRIEKPGYETKTLILNTIKSDTLQVVLKYYTKTIDEIACLMILLAPEATNHVKINKSSLDKSNFGQDIPFMLDKLPSVVTTSDAGMGIGYSGIRVRGIDASRLNVTINGIPINDPESHDVYWVNMPDLVSSIQSIDFQRGVSSSTNGAAAFGASMNIKSNDISETALGKMDVSYGSFHSFKTSIQAHTGIIDKKFFVETRLSKIGSDGYIDRAFSDLSSWYLSAGWIGKQSLLKGVAFSGKEITYQSWYGTPESVLFGNEVDRNAYADRNGLSDADRENLLTSGRTYNFYTYKNQVDHYQQDNYQLHFTHRLKNNKLFINASGHYTYGRGYYEEYRPNEKLSTYLLSPIIIGDDTIVESDIIRRRWLDNHFLGSIYSLRYEGQKWQMSTGGAINTYRGAHFGEVIWARYASNGNLGDRYYDETGDKTEWSHFLKIQNQWNRFKIILDLQYRYISYSFLGLDFVSGVLKDVTQTVDFNFFNPKLSVFRNIRKNQQAYASVARSNREPVRRDFRESTPESRPKHETLLDFELGYSWQGRKIQFKANIYHMNFKNQLVLTGQINDVGAYTRTNVKESFRQGIELETQFKPLQNFTLDGNITLSRNQALNYVDYLDVYLDTIPYITQQTSFLNRTTLSFSPAFIAAIGVSYSIPKYHLSIDWNSKWVGKQFMDNIQKSELPSFNYSALGIKTQLASKDNFKVELSGVINNIFNQKYANNGYAFSYQYSGVKTTERFFYPQAGRNFMLRLSITI